jgi:carboxyl-terminal processing protease
MKILFSKTKLWLLAAILLPLGFYSFNRPEENFFEISKNLDIFTTLFRELNLYYVDDTKPGDLISQGIDGMLESLDPYTNFIGESDIEDYRFMTTGQYGGIGAIIRAKDNKVVVAEPYEGSPAAKAGLMAGDVILEVNGKTTEGKSYEDISSVLKGQPGTEVKIAYERKGKVGKTVVNVSREEIKVKAVQYSGMLNNKVGYINLGSFTDNCSGEVKEAFQQLKTNNKMEALVLDLRGNPGGLLKESVSLCNLFLDKGQTVVYTKGKVQEWNAIYKTQINPTDTEIPIVVLVNSGSASASEIVSGTMQDLDRAVILGQRTYGKGLVQTTRPLSYNTQLKVTTAKYYIPSGRCIQAINYANRNEDGSVGKVPDSLISRFYTLKNKRPVYDGGGILPDVETEPEYFSEISKALVEKSVLFDFATEYRFKHPTVATGKEFEITDAIYNEFTEFVSKRDFKYETLSERELKHLRETAEKEKYFENVKPQYEAMLASFAPSKEKDLTLFKTEVKELLKAELLSRYYFSKGRVESMLKNDPDVKQAIALLQNPEKYKKILSDTTDRSPLKDKVKDKEKPKGKKGK